MSSINNNLLVQTFDAPDQASNIYMSWIFWGIYTVYQLITLPLVIWRINYHPLKSRSRVVVFISLISQYFSVTILCLRIALNRETFPCVFYTLVQFFGWPSK